MTSFEKKVAMGIFVICTIIATASFVFSSTPVWGLLMLLTSVLYVGYMYFSSDGKDE
tara:strand:- start:266 stop:436 length:171 start_codon:yes stop_codon:yes gene_type:complete